MKFDDAINTTSVKQGGAQLLKLLGVEFKLPSMKKT
jgi:hypothetical protein